MCYKHGGKITFKETHVPCLWLSFSLFRNRIAGLKGTMPYPFPFCGGDGLYLIEDTRNQIGKHKNIEQYCRRHGIEIVRQCLPVGDYVLSVDGKTPFTNVSVDTKENLLEIAKNICSSDHRRFKDEVVRANEFGIKLIVLVEELPPFGSVDLWEVPRWKSSNEWHRYGDPMTLIDPKTLRKAMLTMTGKYGVQFRFCTRKQSPGRIIKYLTGEFK